MRLNYCAFLVLIFMWACTSETTEDDFYQNIDVVTGLDFYDDNGNPVGRWKSPNNNPGDVNVYPNPSRGILQISNTEGFNKLYLIPSQCMVDSTERDISLHSLSLSYKNEDVESSAIQEFVLDSNNNNIQLDLTDQTAGFYRLFFRKGEQSYAWENIYINTMLDNQNYLQMIESYCQ